MVYTYTVAYVEEHRSGYHFMPPSYFAGVIPPSLLPKYFVLLGDQLMIRQEIFAPVNSVLPKPCVNVPHQLI